MNIVYSQTKQWNPGDDLILDGIRSLIPDEHTFIIFNRHPHLNFKNRTGDNSYYYGMGDNIIDHVIFAGSPEYQTWPNDDIYKLIENYDVPFYYIGVGGKQHVDRPFHKAKLSICRDSAAAKMPNGEVLPCPSIFANRNLDLSKRTKKDKIAFCFQTGVRYICSPNGNVHHVSVRFINKYKPKVICHSYPDYVEAYSRGWDCFYSSDYREYYKFYEEEVDLVVGTRIHGSGWAANYGIPNITIAHDDRIETAKNFGSVVSQPDFNELCDKFENIDIEKESQKLIDIRINTLPKYMKRMAPFFGTPKWVKDVLKINT